MKRICIVLVFLLAFTTACSTSANKEYPSKGVETPAAKIEDMYMPSSPGTLIAQDPTGLAMIDYSNTDQGYICAKRIMDSQDVLKLAVSKGKEVYYYDLKKTDYESFPLQMGNGMYQFRILKQKQGDQYAVMHSVDVDVKLADAKLPYLYPSQYIDYTPESKAVKKAFALVKNDKTDLSRIYHIYNYVISHVKYDDQKAKDVADKFVLPIIDETYVTNKGICFDYTALLAAMLRSQQIPTRMITGYTSKEYHSWIEVWVKEKGWINPQVYFKKKIWNRIDPTFAAQGEEYDGEYKNRYVY